MYGAVNKSVMEWCTSALGVTVAPGEKRRCGEVDAIVVGNEEDSDTAGRLGKVASEMAGPIRQEMAREKWRWVGNLAGHPLCVHSPEALICPKSADLNRFFVKW